MKKKGITAVVSIGLLILVAVVSASLLFNWFQTYQSELLMNTQKIVTSDSVEIKSIDSQYLYIWNKNSQNISIEEIKIGSKSCGINASLRGRSIDKISHNNCTQNISSKIREVAVFTNSGIFSRGFYVEGVQFTKTSTQDTGVFTGYAWGEQLGYISFNGTGYQVKMNNSNLYGHAYSQEFGYISFNGSNYNVSEKDGVIIGYAYGEHTGYINFNNSPLYQTTFNGTALNGHAYSQNLGYIHFSNQPLYEVTN